MAHSLVPSRFGRRPFTTAQARAAGISADVVRGPAFRKLFRGVYIAATVEMTFLLWLQAALLAGPADAVVSHLSALRVYGLAIGAEQPFHLSTRTSTHSRHERITTHRRLARISARMRSGIPITGPERTIIDIATKVTLVELIQAAEFMIHGRLITLDGLADYAVQHHLDGVLRTRRVLGLIRERVESPMETLVRLMIVFARLPEPACNVDIFDSVGTFIARGDLVYAERRIVVEYDGWHHERDAEQRQRDHLRRERLEATGWRVIVITAADLANKPDIVRRVHDALVARGYTGPEPHLNSMWQAWFR